MLDLDQLLTPAPECRSRRTTQITYHYTGWYSSNRPVAAPGAGWTPPVDVYETLEECVIEVNLGGISIENIRIDIDSHSIRLTGQRPDPQQTGIRCYHLVEIERGGFERVLELPSEVDPNTVQATQKDGLLVIRVSKRRGGSLPGCFPADSMEGFE